MLRFYSESSKLVEYYFDIDIKPGQTGYQVKCSQMYPKEEADANFIKSVELFVFPDPAAIESNMFFSFVLGDTAVDYHHGFVLYENALKAHCIISKFYYPSIYRRILTNHSSDMISFLSALSVDDSGQYVDIDGTLIPLDGSIERQQLYGLLFHTLTPYDIFKIIIGMLEARHIFPVSANPSKLCRFCAALPLLLEPFRWNMNIIPILPTKLRDVANVPVPTIIGLTHPEILLEGRVDHHIIVNIDTRRVIDSPPFDVKDGKIYDVQRLLLEFHQQINSQMHQWSKVKNFPHKHIQKTVKSFIAKYLALYVGKVKSSSELISTLNKLPEKLAESQVLHDLTQLDSLPEDLRSRINNFLYEIYDEKTIAIASRSPIKPHVPKSASSSFMDDMVSHTPALLSSPAQQFDLLGISPSYSTPNNKNIESVRSKDYSSSGKLQNDDFFGLSTPSQSNKKEDFLFVDFGLATNSPAASQDKSNDNSNSLLLDFSDPLPKRENSIPVELFDFGQPNNLTPSKVQSNNADDLFDFGEAITKKADPYEGTRKTGQIHASPSPKQNSFDPFGIPKQTSSSSFYEIAPSNSMSTDFDIIGTPKQNRKPQQSTSFDIFGSPLKSSNSK